MTESETAGSEQQTEEAEDSEAESEITDIDADEFDDLVLRMLLIYRFHIIDRFVSVRMICRKILILFVLWRKE